MKTSITAALALLLTAGASAQTRVIPQNIAWSIQPPNMAPEANYDGLMVNAIRIQVHIGPYITPAAAALAVANQAMSDINAAEPRLNDNGDNLCIILHGWGHDNEDTQDDDFDEATRFFVLPGDKLDGITPEWFPEHPTVRTDRAYRQPWLINATSSTAPLRVWTQQFISAYVALQQSSHPALPDPSRFYVDSEEFIVMPYNVNGIKLLHYLAGTSLWNQPVPGWGGQTAAQLYAAEVARYCQMLWMPC